MLMHIQPALSKPRASDENGFAISQQPTEPIAIGTPVALQLMKPHFESHQLLLGAKATSSQQIELYGSLRFRCPRTGAEVYSGIDTTTGTLVLFGHLTLRVECPFCHSSHLWSVGEGTLGKFESNRTTGAADRV